MIIFKISLYISAWIFILIGWGINVYYKIRLKKDKNIIKAMVINIEKLNKDYSITLNYIDNNINNTFQTETIVFNKFISPNKMINIEKLSDDSIQIIKKPVLVPSLCFILGFILILIAG